MKRKNTIGKIYSTPYQLRLPIDMSIIIDVNDPVYTFTEVMNHIDLRKYFAEEGCRTGRPRCDALKLLKVILFAFMENGYTSLRELERLCRNDIRYIWILDGMKAPSFATFGNFIRDELSQSIEEIFKEINAYIFAEEDVDTSHVYIDGTKIEANANKYTWVWKKSCVRNREKVFKKITGLIKRINFEVLFYYNLQMESREEYAIEYVESLLAQYLEVTGINPDSFVRGPGHRQTTEQKHYEELAGYLERLRKYAEKISVCGEHRNSYSKTDKDATFMRMKRDYMGNDQLLPAYNMQIGVCDEYVAVVDVKQFASDMDCFIPLMEKFKSAFGHYPKYPVADAGYGSYNNYLFCEAHSMGKYMKFTMYDKTVNNEKYRDNPYRAVNFKRDENGALVCPNGRKFIKLRDVHIKGNQYGRTEELYQCEDCEGCPHRSECYKSRKGNRIVRLNQELSSYHQEVLANLGTIQGALLRMNRSIQAEGVYGIVKWDRSYTRAYRRGIESVLLEFNLIFCGFNLYKYHNKRMNRLTEAA